MKKEENKLEKITALAKRRGFVFPGSEIYGGFAGTYDWGPLGTEHRAKLHCSVCRKKDFSKVFAKNLMATSTLGKFSEEDQEVYLREETAQGIFINYKNVLNSGFYSIPFGIAQVGKAFRNEI